MEPIRIGRVLGIGARVAGAKLREGAERLGSTPPAAAADAGPGNSAQQPGRPAGAAAAQEMGARVGAGVRQAAANFRAAQANAVRAQAAGPGSGTAAESGTRRLARGATQFGGALVRPFAHATSLLWAQITGIFFALFAVFFVEHAWMVYRAAHGRDRLVFLYGALALLFTWFAVSTFWRVRRKQRR